MWGIFDQSNWKERVEMGKALSGAGLSRPSLICCFSYSSGVVE